MCIIITASGNGGHLSCGLSIANALRERKKNKNIVFFGSNNKTAKRLVANSGFRFYRIFALGFWDRKVSCLIKFCFSQMISLFQSGILFLYLRPCLVISTGGFTSLGAVFWSWFFKIPCLIHEQNLVPGKANRFTAYFANKILISFLKTKDYFKSDKCIFTGMPIRFNKRTVKQTAKQQLELDPGLFTVLIMGGSMGAHRINELVIETLKKLPLGIQFIHLTGRADLEMMNNIYGRLGFKAYLGDFFDQMDVLYCAADLVISRAGSASLAEITFFGLPAVLIPYPHSRDRHQYENARFMAQEGAAVVMTEENFSADSLGQFILAKDSLAQMAEKSAGLAAPLAVNKIIAEVMRLLNE